MSAIEDTAVSAAAKPTTNPNANACSATGSKLRKEKDLKCRVCGVSEAKSKKGSWIYDEDDDRVGAYCIQLAVGDTTGKHSDATSSSRHTCSICVQWWIYMKRIALALIAGVR